MCGQAYEELGIRVPREHRVAQVKANPDTGAQICVGGPNLLALLGAKGTMIKPLLQIRIVNRTMEEVMLCFGEFGNPLIQ